MGISLSFLTAISLSFSHIFVKKGIEHSEGKNNGFLITVLINFFLLGIAFLIQFLFKAQLNFSFSAFVLFVIAGLLTSGFGRQVFFNSVNLIGPSRASGIKNAAPLFTVVFALIVIRESINYIVSIGLLVIISALFIQGFISIFKTDNRVAEYSHKIYWTGYLMALLAAIFFGVGQGIRKQGLIFDNDPVLGAFIGASSVLVFNLIRLSLKKEIKKTVKVNLETFNRNYVIAGILTTVGPLSFFLASSIIQVSIVSVIAASEPILTILVSYLIFKKEKIDIYVWLASLFILIGSIIIIIGV